MLKQWSELSKAQQREAKEWFERMFKDAVDEHGNAIRWDDLEEHEKAFAHGKLWKYHHERNKPDHAFMKTQDRKRKAELRANEKAVANRLAASDERLDAEAVAIVAQLKQRISEKKGKQKQRTTGLAKRRRMFEKSFDEKMAKDVAERHAKGQSVRTIAAELGCSVGLVMKRLKQLNQKV